MKKLIWLTFDLGIRGDYEGMYTFLDAHGAKECGDSTATLWYEFKNDLVKELARDLAKAVTLEKRSRVYVVFPGANDKYRGRFLFGKRKAPPWAGYGAAEPDVEDVSE